MSARRTARIVLLFSAILLIPKLVPAQSIVLGHGQMLSGCPGVFATCKKSWIEPTLYAGYLYSGEKGTKISFENSAGSLGALTQIEQRFALQGIWLEGLAPMRITDRIGLAVGGAYLIHSEDRSREDYRTPATTPTRRWKTNVQWWHTQGVMTYALSQSFFALAGFRWNHLVTDFKDPYDVVGIATGLPTDESELELNAYLPLLGVLAKVGLAPQTTALAGIIGFPMLPCSYRYGETLGAVNARIQGEDTFETGYFVEAFAEYTMRFGTAGIGIFGKYGAVAGKGTVGLSEASGVWGSGDYDVTLRSHYWVGGAKLAYAF